MIKMSHLKYNVLTFPICLIAGIIIGLITDNLWNCTLIGAVCGLIFGIIVGFLIIEYDRRPRR